MDWKIMSETIKTAIWNCSNTKINEYEVIIPFVDKGIDILYLNYKNKMIAEVINDGDSYKKVNIVKPLDELSLFNVIKSIETSLGKETYPSLPKAIEPFSWKGILADEYFQQREEVIKYVKNITDLKSECVNINDASLLQTAYINAENSEDNFTFNTNYTNEDGMRYFDFLLNVKPEIKSHYEMNHNLPKLIISGEFEVKDEFISD